MKLVILLVALAASIADARHVSGRVSGGDDALPNEFPYQVSLQWNLTEDYVFHYCGGAILSPTWVLTAGSCITDFIQLNIQIVAGSISLDEPGKTVKVVEGFAHPNYTAGQAPNDIGLLRLQTPLVFNQAVQPIGLPNVGTEPSGTVVVTGWGSNHTRQGDAKLTTILQKANVTILPNKECDEVLDDLFGQHHTLLDHVGNICTGPKTDEGKGSCYGDTGGPLVQNNTVVGIVSWTTVPCGNIGTPSIYTNVSNYVDFIKEHVTDLSL